PQACSFFCCCFTVVSRVASCQRARAPFTTSPAIRRPRHDSSPHLTPRPSISPCHVFSLLIPPQNLPQTSTVTFFVLEQPPQRLLDVSLHPSSPQLSPRSPILALS